MNIISRVKLRRFHFSWFGPKLGFYVFPSEFTVIQQIKAQFLTKSEQ